MTLSRREGTSTSAEGQSYDGRHSMVVNPTKVSHDIVIIDLRIGIGRRMADIDVFGEAGTDGRITMPRLKSLLGTIIVTKASMNTEDIVGRLLMVRFGW